MSVLGKWHVVETPDYDMAGASSYIEFDKEGGTFALDCLTGSIHGYCEGDAVDGCVKGERCCTHDLWSSIGRQVNTFLANVTLDDVVNKRNLALAASIRQAKARHVRKVSNEADARLS